MRMPVKKHRLPDPAAAAASFALLAAPAVTALLLLWTGAPRPRWLPPVLALCLLCGAALFLARVLLPQTRLHRTVLQIQASGGDYRDALYHLTPDPALHAQACALFDLIRDAIKREYSALILEKQSELSSLQSQINPHFLYNTLEAIRGKAILEDVPDIAEMAEALASLFRYSISRRGDMATLEDELRNLRNYMVVQQYRFHNKFQLRVLADEACGVLLAELPRMTLQPIVENAVYHGLETKIGQGTITIRVEETDQRILVTVSDDGVGIAEDRLARLNARLLLHANAPAPAKEDGASGSGIALLNVNRRLKLCFGEISGLRVYSTPGVGTDVEISIPNRPRKEGERRET